MLLMLQAIIIEILRFVTVVGVFFTWMWIGNQIRKRRNVKSVHKKRQK
ncbi:HAMP domain-containing protein [Paenibacillus brasilensis]|uniref:HAMP domain-containing protein n=1 Tax=Paenibacillus brasilensis TaxID=128574 RepID=A0ABU0L6R3_9BACL|nr:HAMP domain-containing protein [Paenibacillus brasilensis]